MPDHNPADIRFAAMNFLARREHTQLELLRKLKNRFPDETLVTVEIQRLAAENLQSDQRFAESFVRQRAGRGYGPGRVRQEMRERGLEDNAISLAFEDAGIDWTAMAQTAYLKKFGGRAVVDIRDKAKRIRFMQYRGFSSQHYQYLLEN